MALPKRCVALAAALVVTLAACDSGGDPDTVERSPAPSPASRDSLVVGLVGTMSGGDSWRGEDAFEGADLGIHELNRAGGRNGPSFELVTLDDGGDAATAVELIGELTASERTVGIIYAGPPEALAEAEPLLAEAGIPAVLSYGDLYSARLLSPHVFQVSPPLLWQARRLIPYLVADRGYRTIGALIGGSLAGRAANTGLRSALAENGGGSLRAVSYSQEDPDLEAALSDLRARRVEAIVVEGGPRLMGEVARTLDELGHDYRGTAKARIASARPPLRRARIRSGAWHPQLLGFDLAGGPAPAEDFAPGTAISDSYARGAHYLPIDSFKRFRAAFADWWGTQPTGWEQRAFDAASMIGWATRRAGIEATRTDLAGVLEGLPGRRFGGLTVAFGPDDHTAVEPTEIGLWVVPSSASRVSERSELPESIPWVPLARSFATGGRRTDIPPRDWAALFRNPPPRRAPAPPYTRMRFGVTSPPADPIH